MSNLKKGIVSVFLANMINMIINILVNFLLPKYLSVDTYSYIKTYQLYIGMIGIVHLGYVDGMFLKYGGKEIQCINKIDLNINIATFRLFQTAVTTVAAVFALLITGEYVYLVIALAIIPFNMAGYYKSLYQAIGEFKRYSRLMNATTVATFIVNIILLFGFRTDDYRLYITLYLVINYVIWFALERYFSKGCDYRFKYLIFSAKELVINIKEGILLMLGNFANSFLTSMDRWFVKALMDSFAFAQYSFACSMETMINVAVTPITVTLYNYFCKKPSKENVVRIRNGIIIIASALISCAFPAKFILEIYLTKYIDSSKVIFYLFAAQFFYIVIKSIYVNLYKALHQQKKYFIRLIMIIVIGFFLNVICYSILHTKEAFAIGTLISAFLWFVFSIYDFKEYPLNVQQTLYIILCLAAFFICGYALKTIMGFIIYVIVTIVSSVLLMKEDFQFVLQYAIGIILKKRIYKKEK